MRTDRGLTLVELIVVIAIAGILMTLATLSWNSYSMKAAVEGQIKALHADMMRVRLEALYGKRSRSVVVAGKTFSVYSSRVTTGTPVSTKTYQYGFISTSANTVAADTVTFDTSGMANAAQITICIDAYDDSLQTSSAYVDSLVVSQARLNLAKRSEGGQCDASTSGIKQR